MMRKGREKKGKKPTFSPGRALFCNLVSSRKKEGKREESR